MSTIKDFVSTIKTASDEKTKAYDTTATVTRIEGNTAWVHIPGGVNETPAKMTINAIEGDTVQVRVSGGTAFLVGNGTRPPTDDSTANHAVNIANTVQNDITVLNTVVAENIEATNAKFTTVEADTAKIHDLTADQLTATVGYIGDLNADNISAQNIIADHETVGSLDANYAHITNGVIDNAKIGYADVNDLDAHYAEIDLANVNNAWIEYGAIKKAEVFDENVFDLSGEHATLSKIDASKINVANLRADNLVVRRINGQPVVGGYTLIDSNSPGYSSKNPQALGWYEFVNAQWALSTDTTVDMTKAYYQTGNEVSLYDQQYIDGLENDLQQQIDGAVETFTGSVVPTLTNHPYTDWYDTSVTPVHDERAKHVGDIYYVINSALDEDGYCYRFAYDNTTHAYSWVLIKDSDVTKALGDISELQTFESTTTSWMDETDEGLETIRTNHTALAGVVDKTVKESVQLWFTKANTTAPNKPTAEVTSTSTAGNAWRKVVPAYDASYPNYYYCWQYKFVDGTFGWSNVVRDIAMGETQGTARDAKNTADAALPASTFTSFESTTFKDVKDTVTEHSAKFTNMTSRLGLNSDGTGANTDIVAKESALEQTVDGISTRVGKTETKLIGMYATSSTAAGTAAKVATITPALPSGATWELGTGTIITVKFTNANTTSSPTLNVNSKGAKSIKTYANGNLSEAEYKWAAGSTFTFVYNGTNWLMQDSSVSVRMNSAETSITQNAQQIQSKASQSSVDSLSGRVSTAESTITQQATAIEAKVSKNGVIASINASVEEQGGSAVKISADKVNITGTAVFNAVDADANAKAAMLNSELEIGGRNLLVGTGAANTWTISLNSSNYQAHDCYQTCSPVPSLFAVNDLVTISFDWSTNGTSGNFHIECGKVTPYTWGTVVNAVGTRSATSNYVDITSSNKSGHVSVTFKITSSQTSAAETLQWLRIRVDGADMASKTFTVSNAKVERGNKATDWTPAPEDVQAEIDAKKSTFTINATGTDASQSYATILGWATEGRQLTFAVDSTAGIKVGDTVRIKTTVSNMGTEGNRPAVYFVTTCRETPTSSTSIKTTSHGLDTTIIDGGNILTNSIGANQIAANSIGAKHLTISDNTNLATANEMYESSLPPYSQPTAIDSGYLVKKNATQQYLTVTDYTPNGFKQSDELYYEFYGKAAVAGTVSLNAWGYTGTPQSPINHANNNANISLTTTEQFYSGTLKLSHANWNTSALYLLGFNDYRDTKSQIYIKKLVIRRKNGGELIVDGAITADKIAANAVTSDKIAANAVTVGKINPRVYSYSNRGQGTGYAKLFTISHTLAYHNAPISFLFHNRGKKETRVAFNFTNNSTATSATVQNATYDGDTPFYYVSKGSAVYDVYFQLAESRDDTYVTDYVDQYGTGLEVVWDGAYYGTELPTGAVAFTKLAGSRTSAELDNAAKTATSYITDIDSKNGITIKAVNGTIGTDATKSNYIKLNADGMGIYKGGVSVASYGDTARVGKEGSGHTTIASTGMLVYGSDGTVELANIGYGNGKNSSGGTSSAPYYTFGEKLLNSSNGNYSVGEGYRFTASGWASHAEGYYTEASGASSHAEGDSSMARGQNSHAEGYSTLASGEDSHAGGTNTKASGNSQTAIGKYNIEDTTSLFIVGNGSSSTRSNAFKIDSTGDIYPQNKKMADFVIEQSTSGNWRWHKWNSGIVEAWYLGQNVTYSGTNTPIAFPHTLKKILCLTGNGILNGSALTPLTNLWCSTTYAYITFNATGTKLDNLSLYAVYTV